MRSLLRAGRGFTIAAVLVFAGCSLGMAASLTFSTPSVGGARAATPRCTNAGLAVVPNLSGANVVSATVSGLPAACGNATIQVAVNNGSASGTGSGTVPAGGGSVTVTLGSAVASTAGAEIDLILTGP